MNTDMNKETPSRGSAGAKGILTLNPGRVVYAPPQAGSNTGSAPPQAGTYTADAAPKRQPSLPPGAYRAGPGGRGLVYSGYDDHEEVFAMLSFYAALGPEVVGHVKEIFCDSECGVYSITLYGVLERLERIPVLQKVAAAFEANVKNHSGFHIYEEAGPGDEEKLVFSGLSDLYPEMYPAQ